MNIKLMEAFSRRMEDYIGPTRWAAMEDYLKSFPGYDPAEPSYFNFADDTEAFNTSSQIINDAKAAVAKREGSPAIDYILFRCAGTINAAAQNYNSAVRSTSANGDITGTSLKDYTGYLSEAFITLADQNGVIEHFDVSKYHSGDLMNSVNYYLSLEMKNVGRDLLAAEMGHGIKYDGARSQSVVGVDKATGKYINKATGAVISAEEAARLKKNADIRKMARFDSFDAPSSEGEDSSGASPADKIAAKYADFTGETGEFEDRVIADLDGSKELIQNWEDCCMDTEWTKKNNVKAELLRTLIEDELDGKVTDQITFINKYHLNKQTFRNYMGLSDRETYGGVTIRDILDDYEVNMVDLVSYIKENPDKRDVLLGMLPGGKLHEALKRYMANKRLQEAKKLRESTSSNMVSLSEDVKPYFESFKSAINEVITTVDWSETDGSDIKEILESTLKDGIDAHRNTWKFMAGSFDVGMNKFQKKIVCDILK